MTKIDYRQYAMQSRRLDRRTLAGERQVEAAANRLDKLRRSTEERRGGWLFGGGRLAGAEARLERAKAELAGLGGERRSLEREFFYGMLDRIAAKGFGDAKTVLNGAFAGVHGGIPRLAAGDDRTAAAKAVLLNVKFDEI